MRKTKAKAKTKTAIKAKTSKKKNPTIKSQDGFELHPLSPMPYCDLVEWLNEWSHGDKKFDKKVEHYVFDGEIIQRDPIYVALAFQKLKLKWEIDRRNFMVDYNDQTKTLRFTSEAGSDDAALPVGCLYKLLDDFKRKQINRISGLKSINGTLEQVEAINRAFNQAIISLEEFLVKNGQMHLEEKTCQAGMHPFTPANSVSDACKECEEDFELDSLQAKKDAREKSEAAF